MSGGAVFDEERGVYVDAATGAVLDFDQVEALGLDGTLRGLGPRAVVPSEAERRLERAVEAAESAMWAEVARHYPEVTTGDLDPWESHMIAEAIKRVIKSWLWENETEESEEELSGDGR